jgi:hypothetical protein
MKRLMTSAVAAVALLAAGANILWPRSASPATTLGMPPLQALADVNKFPNDEFEDQSLVFSAAAGIISLAAASRPRPAVA